MQRFNLSQTLRLIVMMMAVAALISAGEPATIYSAQAGPTFALDVPARVALRHPIHIQLTLRQARNIAGYELTLLYDTAVVDVHALHQRDNDLRRFGRGVGPLGPVERPDGVTIGLYSCPFDDCVRYDRNHPRKPEGANGTVRLGMFALTPKKAGTLEIKLTDVKVVAADGRRLAVDVPTQTWRVQVGDPGAGPLFAAPQPPPAPSLQPGATPGPFDLTGEGRVNHADSMEVATRWTQQRERGQACTVLAEPLYDVNHDGCLDIADLQLIAFHYSDDPIQAGATSRMEGMEASDATNATFVVNVATDEPDATVGNGVCATAAGVCTLRAAIQEANARSGPDTITFNIPGTGVHTINLSGTLPSLNDLSGGTTIDGYTQPGSAPNTDPLISNAAIRIQIQGFTEDNFNALVITSGDNVVRGVAIYKAVHEVWLFGSAATNNAILGSYIGTDAAGNYAAPQAIVTSDNIALEIGAANNRIGSPALADRNVISGSAFNGILLKHEATNGNIMVNNLIGLGPRGDKALRNWTHGIDINVGSSYNVIGGTAPGERNVISANNFSGVEVSHDTMTKGNRIVGNFIGTDATGNQGPAWAKMGTEFAVRCEDGVQDTVIADNVLGNTPYEVVLIDGVNTTNTQVYNNRIGVSLNGTPLAQGGSSIWINWPSSGNTIGPNNIIANSPGSGVYISNNENIRNTITQNSIYNHAQMGIELLYLVGVNPIGSGGPGTMANEGVDYPQLLSATPSQVTGTACAGCRVELFVAQRQMTDLSNGAHGQGRTFITSGTVGANGQFTLPISGVAVGDWLTATTTDSRGNTSEFSANIQVAATTGGTHRINAGGPAYTDTGGRVWSADTGFTGGSTYSVSAPIANTNDDTLYQSERYGAFSYNLPVTSGSYQVTLKFAEIWFTQAGQRVFNVAIEGQTVLSNFDILSQVAPNTALDRVFTTTVTDGWLTITFTSVVSNPKVAAIEVVPASGATATPTATPIPATPTPTATPALPTPTPTRTPTPAPATAQRINSGGSAYTDTGGRVWSADTGFTGGSTYSVSAPIANTNDDTLYQSERYGAFSYNLPVTSGSYQVTLKFAEIWFTQAGQRVFNVAIEGQTVLSNFDILSQVAPNTALDRTFTVTVNDGALNIVFTSVINNAKVAAIEVLSAGP